MQIKCGRLFMHVRVNKRKQNEVKKKEKRKKCDFGGEEFALDGLQLTRNGRRGMGGGAAAASHHGGLSLAGGERRSKGPPRP